MTIDIKIGKIITSQIEKNNKSRLEIATLVGVQKATLSRWESGQVSVKVKYLPDLCKALDLNIGELLKRANLIKIKKSKEHDK